MVIFIDAFTYINIRNHNDFYPFWYKIFFLITYLILGNHKSSDDIELSEAIKRSFNIQTSQESEGNGMFI